MVHPLYTDTYIRLSKNKYLKLFHKGDEFEPLDFEKYTVNKGVQYLYLRQDQLGVFVQKYEAALNQVLQAPAESLEAATLRASDTHETVQQLGLRVGFKPEIQQIAKTQIAVTLKAIGESPSLKTILERLKGFEGEYISTHSTLTAYLACAIATKMHWASASTFYKLNMAAFLHDIVLENHELARCNRMDDTAKAYFGPEEVKNFEQHPIKAAEVAKKFHEIPADVDTIILQHHERPDRSGFPRQLNHTYIAPLSAVFIVAHDLAQAMLNEKKEPVDIHRFIRTRPAPYRFGQFKHVMTALESVVLS